MASIIELIKNIRNARLGKDVRESIASAIEQTYEDATEKGSSNMEVAQARGTFNTLRERLNNSDSVKASKQEVDIANNNLQNQINSLASGSPLVASSVSEMTDTTRVYVNTTDGHWYWHDGTTWQDGGAYQTAENSNAVNQLINFIDKGSVNLYDKRDLSWTRANFDSVPLNLKAEKYIISLVSTGTSGTFTVQFRNDTTIVASKILNNQDFNVRNSFDIELSSDINNFRIWNDVACEIKDIMIIPYYFGNLDYIKSNISNQEVIDLINNNFNYVDNIIIDKLENDLGEVIDITDDAEDSEYGYYAAKKFNKTYLYTQSGSSNYHKDYSVSFNEHYKVSLYKPTSGSIYPIFFTDDDLNVIDYLTTNVSDQATEFDFTIPYGATKLLISHRVGNSYPLSIKKYIYKDLNTVVKDINSGIPTYYKEHLNSKIDEINALEQNIGVNGDTVGFITDIHVPSNSMNSPYLLKEIYNKTNLSMVFDGGDSAFGSSSVINTKELAISELYESINSFNVALNNRIIRNVGNHDNNGYGAYYQEQVRIEPNELFGILFKRQTDKVVYDENNPYGNYCYYDNEKQKIRYIILSTEETGEKKGFSVACTEWLVNKAFVFPTSGWSVAIFTHQPIKDNNNYYRHREMFKALNNGTTFNWEDTYGTAVYNIHADFTGNKQANVLFVACGHMHQDGIGIDNNVVYFQTTCDAHYNDDYSQLGYRRDAGTVYEQAFDIICINKQTKHIDLVRVGAGNNRGFTYGTIPSIDE